ncbi:MAG: hypothetical protein RRB22_03515 [Gammaproteobacteria bacterium]|nr:hypothetical protein [Gammaproteobacteria bacterium]
MGTYDYAIGGAILCGIIMVLGGIVLLYKGAIRLEVAAQDPALTVEMFQKELKFTTRVPALGLFIIGLCFVVLAIYFGQDVAATAIEVRGKTEGVDEQVTIRLQSQWPIDAHQGQVHQVVRPQLDVLWVVVSAPGYKPHYISFSRDELRHGVDFGSVKLTRATPRVEASAARIAELPPGVAAPPLASGGSFGRGGPL